MKIVNNKLARGYDGGLFGASLKDLGKKCFAFTRLDPAEIPHLKSRIYIICGKTKLSHLGKTGN